MKNDTAVLVPVRLGSSRLPRKALISIVGQPALGHLLERMKLASGISRIVVCTTQEAEDGELVDLAIRLGVDYYRGPTQDLLERLRAAANHFAIERVVNVDGDDILIDPDQVDAVVRRLSSSDVDYVKCDGLPFGAAPIGMTYRALENVCLTKKTINTETGWGRFFTESSSVRIATISDWGAELAFPTLRMTLDYPEDLLLFERIFGALYRPGHPVRLREAIRFVLSHKDVQDLTNGLNEKYWAHFAKQSAKINEKR